MTFSETADFVLGITASNRPTLLGLFWEAGSRYNLVPLSFYHIVWTDMELPRSSNEQWHVLSGRSVVRGINSCQDGTNKRAASTAAAAAAAAAAA